MRLLRAAAFLLVIAAGWAIVVVMAALEEVR
jgi:hypothetical protein